MQAIKSLRIFGVFKLFRVPFLLWSPLEAAPEVNGSCLVNGFNGGFW